MDNLLKPLRILVIDDNIEIAELVAAYLEKHFYQVTIFSDPTKVVDFIELSIPDLIILDLIMPQLDGLTLAKKIKQRWSIPIIILTAVSDEIEEIVAFETACDDYLVKPFELRVILAHIKSLLRRRDQAQLSAEYKATKPHFHHFTLILEARRLITPERIVTLSLAEHAILSFLAYHPNQAHTRQEICAAIKKQIPLWDERRVDLVISQLRKKIDYDAQGEEILKTVKQQGYLLAATVRTEI